MLSTGDITIVLLDLGILLGFSRLLGEIARRYRQPMVVGELLAGIILGPTILGSIAPELQHLLFPLRGNTLIALEGLTTVAVVLFMLVAGIEISLHSVIRQGRTVLSVSVLGIAFPFLLGFSAAYLWPFFFGVNSGADPIAFALFLGTALSISALPVIAKILMDLNMLKSDLGSLVIASAALNDIAGWIIFSIVLSVMGAGAAHGLAPREAIILILLFAVFTLTVLRAVFDRILPWLERKTVWPGGILGFVFAFTMIGAAATQWLGVHAVFGAFLVGVAVGDSKHLTARAKDIVSQFATNFFAPLFFAFIGLRIDFAANFNLLLILAVVGLACAGKILGCTAGAQWNGLSGRESLAVGFGMNARGAMEIILGLLALEFGVIQEDLFVALVVMAIVTTMLSGPVMERLMRKKVPLTVLYLLTPGSYIQDLGASTCKEAIRELADRAAHRTGIESSRLFKAIWEREENIGTAIGGGVAVPHARLIEIASPAVIVGRSMNGVDFDATDGAPVHFIFLILTPARDQGAQLQILADIARRFRGSGLRSRALHARNYDEFLQAIEHPDNEMS